MRNPFRRKPNAYVLLRYEDGHAVRLGPMTYTAAEAVVYYRMYDERQRRVISARIVR